MATQDDILNHHWEYSKDPRGELFEFAAESAKMFDHIDKLLYGSDETKLALLEEIREKTDEALCEWWNADGRVDQWEADAAYGDHIDGLIKDRKMENDE